MSEAEKEARKRAKREKKLKKMEEERKLYCGYTNGEHQMRLVFSLQVAFLSWLYHRQPMLTSPFSSPLSAESNPFGDTNLTETFVWKKKYDKEGTKSGVDLRKVVKEKMKAEAEERLKEVSSGVVMHVCPLCLRGFLACG